MTHVKLVINITLKYVGRHTAINLTDIGEHSSKTHMILHIQLTNKGPMT